MTSFFGRAFGVALLAMFGWCGTAQAVTVDLHYSGVVSSTSLPGGLVGSSITFDVFADNGGTGLNSQTWSFTNIIFMTLHAGIYSATTSGVPLGGGGGFTTNASGQLSTLSVSATQAGIDTFGNTLFGYFMNTGNPILFVGGNFLSVAVPPNLTNTTISLASTTPLPAALPLFVTGLGALGLIGWRRKRKQTA